MNADRFTLEDDTLYFGRTDERHGFNLGQLTDRSFNALDILNAQIDSIEFLKGELAQLANFNPDWDMLQASRENHREQMQINKALRAENKEHIDAYQRILADYLALRAAMQEFINRCEAGSVRSTYTYTKFKELLK